MDKTALVQHSSPELKGAEVIWQSKSSRKSQPCSQAVRHRPNERLIPLGLSSFREIEPSGRGRLAKSFSRSGRKSSSCIRGEKRNMLARRRQRKGKRARKEGRRLGGPLIDRKGESFPPRYRRAEKYIIFSEEFALWRRQEYMSIWIDNRKIC